MARTVCCRAVAVAVRHVNIGERSSSSITGDGGVGGGRTGAKGMSPSVLPPMLTTPPPALQAISTAAAAFGSGAVGAGVALARVRYCVDCPWLNPGERTSSSARDFSACGAL